MFIMLNQLPTVEGESGWTREERKRMTDSDDRQRGEGGVEVRGGRM
jgi:hypothetical protein